jgi:spermidine/putrescine transport system ATP-binding protein
MMEQFAVQLDRVTKRFDEVVAVDDVSLEIRDGEFFSLLGPSGCGKTTTLRMIAGFEQPSAGEIFIKGQPVAGISAYRRPVNTVFQSYALFPHMTVMQNVAFGLEMDKVSKGEIEQRSQEALELVQLPQMGSRKPKQLSGGQRQRVALARALVKRPQVLLLDEPLGALDLKLRKDMQLELKQIQTEVGITFIYVTHDQEEAMTMSDRIAVMDHGVVMQLGSARQIYEHPSSRFVADFIGETNFIDGQVAGSDDFTTVSIGDLQVKGSSDGRKVENGQDVSVAIRPEKIRLTGLDENGSDTVDIVNVKGKVIEAIYIGTDTRYRVRLTSEVSLFVRMQNFSNESAAGYTINDIVNVRWNADDAQVLTE